MTSKAMMCACALATLLLGGGGSLAQDDPSQTNLPTGNEASNPSSEPTRPTEHDLDPRADEDRIDPFASDDAIRRAARTRQPGPARLGAPALASRVVVRGTLEVQGKPAAALLEMGGTVVVVRPGDHVGVPGAAALRVESIQDGVVTIRWDEGTRQELR